MNKKRLTFFFLLAINLVIGQIPAGYYDNAQGLTGYQLKTTLKQIITSGHVAHSYDELYTAYETTDTDYYYENDGTVLDMYSENPIGPDPYNYHHHQNTCGNYQKEGDCYNREHLVPQSWFSSAMPMKADAHHVVPSDGKVNGMRGHFPLADVDSESWTSMNGSKKGTCLDPGYSGTVFEPIDEFKGDIARIYFYMATRYEDEIGSWQNANADGSQAVLDGTSDHVFNDWYLQVLIQWHNQDPVSQREIDRNNAVYDYQGNRNPFIDHPEWVNAIWNQNPDTTPPTIPTDLMVSETTDTTISITWSASSDDVSIASYQIFVNGNLVGETADLTFIITNLSPTTTYDICIKAKDTSGNLSGCSNSVQATTKATPNYVFIETFDNCPTMNFISINEASDKNWTCTAQYGENDSPAIQINGYQEDVPSKDWLITSSSIDFDQYTNEILSMFVAYAYGTTPLEFVYSTDYDGNGQPWLFTWTTVPNVNIPVPSGATSTTEVNITNVDISSLNGSVYLAFKYYSNGSPTRWTVDSVKIEGTSTTSVNELLNRKISLYPNPITKGKVLKFAVNNLQIDHISLYDLTGKQINAKFNLSSKTLNINNLHSGMYVLKIQTEKGLAIKKLIIK